MSQRLSSTTRRSRLRIAGSNRTRICDRLCWLVGERGLSAFGCAAEGDASAVCEALSPVTVTCVGPLEYVCWPKRALVQHLAARPGARACIMALVAQDESRKLRAAEGKLVADEK